MLRPPGAEYAVSSCKCLYLLASLFLSYLCLCVHRWVWFFLPPLTLSACTFLSVAGRTLSSWIGRGPRFIPKMPAIMATKAKPMVRMVITMSSATSSLRLRVVLA